MTLISFLFNLTKKIIIFIAKPEVKYLCVGSLLRVAVQVLPIGRNFTEILLRNLPKKSSKKSPKNISYSIFFPSILLVSLFDTRDESLFDTRQKALSSS